MISSKYYLLGTFGGRRYIYASFVVWDGSRGVSTRLRFNFCFPIGVPQFPMSCPSLKL